MRFEFNKLKDIGINEYDEYLRLINAKEQQILAWLVNNMFYETLDVIYNTPGYDLFKRNYDKKSLNLNYLFTLRRECYNIYNNLYFYSINKRLFDNAFNDVSEEEKYYADYMCDRDSMNKVDYWRTFKHGINHCVNIPGEYLILILCRKIREGIINVNLLDSHLTMNVYNNKKDMLNYISRFTASISFNLVNNFVLLDNYVNMLRKKIENSEVKFDEDILKLERGII